MPDRHPEQGGLIARIDIVRNRLNPPIPLAYLRLFGESDGSEKENDLKFIQLARQGH